MLTKSKENLDFMVQFALLKWIKSNLKIKKLDNCLPLLRIYFEVSFKYLCSDYTRCLHLVDFGLGLISMCCC